MRGPCTFLSLTMLFPLIAGAEQERLPRPDGGTLFTDGKGHYLALAKTGELPRGTLGYPVAGPRAEKASPLFVGDNFNLYYGDGKRMFLVRRDEPELLSGAIFLDPRYRYKEPLFSIRVGPRYIESTDYGTKDNPVYKNVDLRLFSLVYVDEDSKQAVLRCGERSVKLSPVPEKQAKAMLQAAKVERSPRKWRPYALTRDDLGNYYYVDRGVWPDTEKQFRLFAGAKGDLKLQKMTNVVSDSEGDIFATKTGSLRLIIGLNKANWVEGENSRPLTMVPPDKNLSMIFNDLGVYAGEKLGTPCDEM